MSLLAASPEIKPLPNSEHFSVDGTLLRARVSHSSLERIGRLDDDPPPPSVGIGFGGTVQLAREEPKATSAVCCFHIRPAAQASIAKAGCSKRLLVLVPS